MKTNERIAPYKLVFAKTAARAAFYELAAGYRSRPEPQKAIGKAESVVLRIEPQLLAAGGRKKVSSILRQAKQSVCSQGKPVTQLVQRYSKTFLQKLDTN